MLAWRTNSDYIIILTIVVIVMDRKRNRAKEEADYRNLKKSADRLIKEDSNRDLEDRVHYTIHSTSFSSTKTNTRDFLLLDLPSCFAMRMKPLKKKTHLLVLM